MKLRVPSYSIACAVYFALHVSAHLSASFFEVSEGISIWYAPCGLALSVLVILGPSYWPIVLLANLFTASLFSDNSHWWAPFFYPALITANYSVAAWIALKFSKPSSFLSTRREALAFGALTVLAPASMAFLGVGLPYLFHPDEKLHFFTKVYQWWVGDMSGILTVVPVALVFAVPALLENYSFKDYRARFGQVVQPMMIIQFLILLLCLDLVFEIEGLRDYNAFYICFLPLIWICLRLGLIGATLATLLMTMGGLIGMHYLGSTNPLITNFMLFELAAAAVGLGLGSSVTNRNRAERALTASEARFGRIIQGAHLGLWEWDCVSNMVTYSPYAAEMMGYDRVQTEINMNDRIRMVHPSDRERLRSTLQSHLRNETAFYECEYRVRSKKDLTWKWVLARGSVMSRDAQGKPLHVSGTHIDTTARNRAEAETTRLLEIIQATTDFVVTTDVDGNILFSNTAIERLFETGDSESLLGRSLFSLIPEGAVHWIRLEAIPKVLAGKSVQGESALLNAKGREIPVSLVILAHADDESEAITLSFVIRDISQQKLAEAERMENERKMLQIQKLESLGVLAGGIAHDFNNLLTVVLGNASLARFDLPVESKMHAPLTQIENAALSAAQLCQQMLAYAGKSPLAFADIDLPSLIEDTTHLLQVSLGKKHTIEFDLARPSALIHADPTQIRQVIMNLSMNASQAIGDVEGRITLRTRLRLLDSTQLAREFGDSSLAPGRYLILEVEDTGCGMDPHVLNRIFEPFFTTKFAGHGLGLAAVMGIIKSHKGGIHVSSRPGQGSCFRILFPALETQTEELPDKANGTNSPWMSSGLVLVVDDEEGVRSVVTRTLKNLGFTPIQAADGFEAVEIYSRNLGKIRCVLLDLTMPRMDGEETFKALQAVDPKVSVVLMSGYSEKLSLGRFTETRPAAFIAKPFGHQALSSCLKQISMRSVSGS